MAQEHWIGQCIWLAADDLARISGRHVSTVGRRLLRLYDDGMVDCINVGRGGRSERRWRLTSAGLREVYPVLRSPHRHPARDGHVHDPLHPELDEHQHPPRSVSKEGAGLLYRRMEVVQAFYDLFGSLFDGEGGAWDGGEGVPRPVRWRWLRATQLVDAIGTYADATGEMHIGFCWVGLHLSEQRLLEKRHRRFSSSTLERASGAEMLEQRRDPLIDDGTRTTTRRRSCRAM